jgi:arylamine N-acetyltransferase
VPFSPDFSRFALHARAHLLQAVPNGRITLVDLKLITTKNGTRQERLLASEEERRGVLNQCFGIVL